MSPVRDASEAHLEDLLSERLVRALRQPALLVEQREEADRRRRRAAGARRRIGEHLDARLVVGLVDRVPPNRFADVNLLLGLEDRRVEVCLQPLVGEVDAELLERVHLELLEAEDVEHADERARLGFGQQRFVDPRDEPVEHARVQRLRERVARERLEVVEAEVRLVVVVVVEASDGSGTTHRLRRLQGNLVDRFRHRLHRPRGERLLEGRVRHA